MLEIKTGAVNTNVLLGVALVALRITLLTVEIAMEIFIGLALLETDSLLRVVVTMSGAIRSTGEVFYYIGRVVGEDNRSNPASHVSGPSNLNLSSLNWSRNTIKLMKQSALCECKELSSVLNTHNY